LDRKKNMIHSHLSYTGIKNGKNSKQKGFISHLSYHASVALTDRDGFGFGLTFSGIISAVTIRS
jgi:hypothetical protein